MRTFLVAVATFAAGMALPATSVHAALYKCTSPDGTVVFQTRACDPSTKQEPVQGSGPTGRGVATVAAEPPARKTDGRVVVLDDKVVAQNCAVADREEVQRRDRCANYQANIAQQRAVLAEAKSTTTARKKAADEIAIQERRQKDDGCA